MTYTVDNIEYSVVSAKDRKTRKEIEDLRHYYYVDRPDRPPLVYSVEETKEKLRVSNDSPQGILIAGKINGKKTAISAMITVCKTQHEYFKALGIKPKKELRWNNNLPVVVFERAVNGSGSYVGYLGFRHYALRFILACYLTRGLLIHAQVAKTLGENAFNRRLVEKYSYTQAHLPGAGGLYVSDDYCLNCIFLDRMPKAVQLIERDLEKGRLPTEKSPGYSVSWSGAWPFPLAGKNEPPKQDWTQAFDIIASSRRIQKLVEQRKAIDHSFALNRPDEA